MNDGKKQITPMTGLRRIGKPERLLILDPHPLCCDALNLTLRISFSPKLLHVAHDLRGAQALIRDNAVPDAIVLDPDLPDAIGTEAIFTLRRLAPNAPVTVLSGDLRPAVIAAALAAGAQGYVSKTETRDAVVSALGRVWAGNLATPPGYAAEHLSVDDARTADLAQRFAMLTPQQVAILRLICQGQSNAEIASALGISELTVKTHVTAILSRIGAQRRTQALLLAQQMMLCGKTCPAGG